MKGKVLSASVILGAVLGFFGYPRLKVPRRPSQEGIEEAELTEAYNRFSGTSPQFRALRSLMIEELAHYGPEGTLVDVGCGPGYLLADIAARFPDLHLIGVDVSQGMLDLASGNLKAQGLGDHIEFRAGEAQHLPFDDDSVDFVVSSGSLHHWSAPGAALQEMHRVLKPGGQVLIFDGRRDARRAFYWLTLFAREFVVPSPIRGANEPAGSILASYTPTEVETLLAESPFRLRRVQSGPAWLVIWARKDW